MYTNTGNFKVIKGGTDNAEDKKADIRARMKRLRGETENRDTKEALLLENFLSSSAIEFQSFLVYLSFSSEAGTDKLIEALIGAGKTVYCPRVEGSQMVAVPYGEDLSLSPLGIREPTAEAYEGEIDVAVVPFLAADETGTRLGYGGGFYDRFLRKHKETKAVGYGFDFQVVNGLPSTAADVPLNMIVTDKRILLCGAVR